MDAKQLLEKYRTERRELVEKVRELDITVRRIESDLGETPEALEDVETPDLIQEDRAPVSRVKASPIEPDEFFGLTQGEAAIKYLEMVGRAVSLDQLVEALKKGGCKVGGADPKRTLYISLIRNTREFVPPRQGYIGLRKFYPHLKAGATKKKQ